MRRRVLGWSAVTVSTLVASFWALWGIVENFFEGWYYRSLWANLGLLLVQYLAPSLLIIAVAVIAIYAPRLGAAIHLGLAVAALILFLSRGRVATAVLTLIVIPLLLVATAYWFGRVEPRRWAVAAVAGIPFLTLCAAGVVPAYRASQRVDDGNRAARRIAQNGVDLVWAPAGPGWPEHGVTWPEAARRCRFLAEDGQTLSARPQNIWRLPAVGEVVRSMQLHRVNSRGVWDAARGQASYALAPDKESPLWDVHSPVIYWWTNSEPAPGSAYVVAINGRVIVHAKDAHRGYLAFRAVKAP